MLYQRNTFTCPASSNTSQMRWDYAFLTEAEFRAKYSPGLYSVDGTRMHGEDLPISEKTGR